MTAATIERPAAARPRTGAARLGDLSHKRQQLDRQIAVEVAGLRELGVSWRAIGAQLGVTGEAARLRYGA